MYNIKNFKWENPFDDSLLVKNNFLSNSVTVPLEQRGGGGDICFQLLSLCLVSPKSTYFT